MNLISLSFLAFLHGGLKYSRNNTYFSLILFALPFQFGWHSWSREILGFDCGESAKAYVRYPR